MDYILQTKEVTKTYGHKAAVNHVSMNVCKGDIYGLIGRNGAGKSTLMKMICQLVEPSSGEIYLFGEENQKRLQKRVGCMIEQPALFPEMTAIDNLQYYNRLMGIDGTSNVDEVLSLVGLKDLLRSESRRKKTKQFSLGMKQRLAIAIALLGYPDFLVLDEPINGLDPAGIVEVRDLILKLNKEREITVLISSHILGELSRVSNRYGVIEQGNLVEEFSDEELEDRCNSYIKVIVDDVNRAAYVLEESLQLNSYKVMDKETLQIYDHFEQRSEINRVLVSAGINVSELSLCGQDLEQYFMNLMGGKQNA